MLSAYISASFRARARYTEVLALVADKVPAGATVRVTCDGRGCPHGRESLVATRAGAIDLEDRFAERHLRVGDRITVTISDQGMSRRDVYTIRSHRAPVAREAS